MPIEKVDFPSVSVCFSVSDWPNPSFGALLRYFDKNDKSFTKLFAEEIQRKFPNDIYYDFSKYIDNTGKKCHEKYEDYSWDCDYLNDVKEDSEVGRFLHYLNYNSEESCYYKDDTMKWLINMYFAQKLKSDLEITTYADEGSTKYTLGQAWLEMLDMIEGGLTITNICSAHLNSTHPVMKWCNACWDSKNQTDCLTSEHCGCWYSVRKTFRNACIMESSPLTVWQWYDFFMTTITPQDKYSHLNLFNKDVKEVQGFGPDAVWYYLNGIIVNDFLDEYFTKSPSNYSNVELKQVKQLLSGLDEEEKYHFFEWILNPKPHGNIYEDYVLIPLCSFGTQTLTDCHLFEKSPKFYLDDKVCYTFQGNLQNVKTSIKPYHGLNIVVNFRMPIQKQYLDG